MHIKDGIPKYNVTAFVYADNEKFKESENLHILRANARRDEAPSEEFVSNCTSFKEIKQALNEFSKLVFRKEKDEHE